MDVKQRLIDVLPTSVKQLMAVPYDLLQTTRADRTFRQKTIKTREPGDEAPAHVVVVVVDALRGDAVDHEYSPYLATLEGTTEAIAPSPWTFPSVTSMVTGLYPHEHGSLRPSKPNAEGLQLPPKLPGSVETLSEVFAGAGYDTYGGFGHQTPFVALSGRFETHALFHNLTAAASDVFAAYSDWLSGRNRTFAFLHLADPHIPVNAPEEYRKKHGVDDGISGLERWRYSDIVEGTAAVERYRQHRKRLYRATVDYVDDQVSSLAQKLPGDSVMIVTSDHGEAFWEHVALDMDRFDGTGTVGHGGTPYEGVARVPLLSEDLDLRCEDDCDRFVSLVDLVPTLLDVVGLSDALETTGQSLLGPGSNEVIPLIEGTMAGYEKKAVYSNGWKLIASEHASAEFVLPDEKLANIPDAEKDRMEAELPGWERQEESTQISGLVENRLRDLGYT